MNRNHIGWSAVIAAAKTLLQALSSGVIADAGSASVSVMDRRPNPLPRLGTLSRGMSQGDGLYLNTGEFSGGRPAQETKSAIHGRYRSKSSNFSISL